MSAKFPVFVAVIAKRATAAPLNPAMNKDEILFSLNDLDAVLLVGPPGVHKSGTEIGKAVLSHSCDLAEINCEGGKIKFSVTRNLGKARTTSMRQTSEDFVALALHTSGTTGKPKGVPLRQSNLLASARNVRDAYHLTPHDRSVLVMPLFHIHGIVAGLLAPLICGSCIIVPGKGIGSDFWKDFEEHSATWWIATPSHHKILLSFSDPSLNVNVRFIRSCSSPLAPSLLAQMDKAFRAPVLEACAMTENAHHIASMTESRPRKIGSVGRPCPGVSLKIIDEHETQVGPGIIGEVVIKGASVMSGYQSNPEANKRAFTSDGFLRTGDFAWWQFSTEVSWSGRHSKN